MCVCVCVCVCVTYMHMYNAYVYVYEYTSVSSVSCGYLSSGVTLHSSSRRPPLHSSSRPLSVFAQELTDVGAAFSSLTHDGKHTTAEAAIYKYSIYIYISSYTSVYVYSYLCAVSAAAPQKTHTHTHTASGAPLLKMYTNMYTRTPEFAPLAAAAVSHSTRKPRRFACVAACSRPSSVPALELAGARGTTSGCACESLRQYLYFCTSKASARESARQ